MKHIKLLGLALMAMLILSATAVATASAAEETKILPEPTAAKPLAFTDKSGEGTLETLGGSTVKCKKDVSKGSFTSSNLGKYEVLFEECKGPLSTVCTGTGDASGTIHQEGVVHFWLALLSEKLVAALVYLVEQFHFLCKLSTIEQLILVRGCIAALAEKTNELVTTTKDVFALKSGSKGDPDISEVLPQETTKEIACELESSINGGAFESSGLTGTDTNEKFEQGGKSVTVLLHNP